MGFSEECQGRQKWYRPDLILDLPARHQVKRKEIRVLTPPAKSRETKERMAKKRFGIRVYEP